MVRSLGSSQYTHSEKDEKKLKENFLLIVSISSQRRKEPTGDLLLLYKVTIARQIGLVAGKYDGYLLKKSKKIRDAINEAVESLFSKKFFETFFSAA